MNTSCMREVRISVLKQIANAVVKNAINNLRHKKAKYVHKQDAYIFLKNLDDWFLVDAFELTDKNRASINELVSEYEKNKKL